MEKPIAPAEPSMRIENSLEWKDANVLVTLRKNSVYTDKFLTKLQAAIEKTGKKVLIEAYDSSVTKEQISVDLSKKKPDGFEVSDLPDKLIYDRTVSNALTGTLKDTYKKKGKEFDYKEADYQKFRSKTKTINLDDLFEDAAKNVFLEYSNLGTREGYNDDTLYYILGESLKSIIQHKEKPDEVIIETNCLVDHMTVLDSEGQRMQFEQYDDRPSPKLKAKQIEAAERIKALLIAAGISEENIHIQPHFSIENLKNPNGKIWTIADRHAYGSIAEDAAEDFVNKQGSDKKLFALPLANLAQSYRVNGFANHYSEEFVEDKVIEKIVTRL